MGSSAAIETATVFSRHSIEYRQVGKRKLNFRRPACDVLAVGSSRLREPIVHEDAAATAFPV
jgi:hypothetical protein